MRKEKVEDPPEDIPFWFITYSDVITLLMTFFILLLTFATNEPEKFERMQVAVFGGGGANGVAEQIDGTLEKDSILYRMRPRSSRMTTRGSEMPPIESDPTYYSLASGLAGLNEPLDHSPTQQYAMDLPLSLIVSEDGQVTALGHQRLRMLARQLRKAPFRLLIQVARIQEMSKAVAIAEKLIDSEAIAPGKIGVGVMNGPQGNNKSLRFVLSNDGKE